MSNNLMLDVGQANELKAAFRREGWTNEEIKMLCERKGFLADVRQALRGHAFITVVEHVIDCDADPFIPEGWYVKEHQKGNKLRWDMDAQKDALYLSGDQKDWQNEGYVHYGDDLHQYMSYRPVLNACVLDYLLANPTLIPKNWKSKEVFFWGTVYKYNVPCVRSLLWQDDKWRWSKRNLCAYFQSGHPAALRAD